MYNNGITLVVEKFEKSPNNIEYYLTEPYIVNGCQTTRYIWDVLDSKLDAGGDGIDEELEKWKEKLNHGIVVIKVVQIGADQTSGDLLNETTKYTNSNNSIKNKDFLALSSDFQTWARGMSTNYGIFLEIQRGGWIAQKAFQKQNPNEMQYQEYANAFDLIKVYGAGWMCEAGKAFGQIPPFAPGGSIFDKIINEMDFELEDLYAAYLLHNVSIELKFGRKNEKPSRALTRYLFYFVFIDLLKNCFLPARIKPTNKLVTKVVLKLNENNNLLYFNKLSELSADLVDDYLTEGSENSVYDELYFLEKGSNPNAFFKSDKIGSDVSVTPQLTELMVSYKRINLRNRLNGTTYQDLIAEIIKNTV